MFRNQTQTAASFAALATLAVLLTFAAGCNNPVVGPEHQASSPSVQQPRVPVELAGDEKTAPPTTEPVPGDLTGDGYVDASDLAAFAFLMRADLNRDEVINNTDLQVLSAILNGQIPDLVAPLGTIDASDFAAFAAAKGRADLTMDGHVDASDLVFFTWMRGRGDFNHDGVVSRRDRQLIMPDVTP